MRNTGRTLRMCQEALENVEDGLTVCVVARDPVHREQIRKQLMELDPDHNYLRWSDRKNIEIVLMTRVNFNPYTTEGYIDGRRHDAVLYDHFTLEDKFRNLLELIHKYDEAGGTDAAH